jgi:hypothetical protein
LLHSICAGLPANASEMTCAIPGSRLGEVVTALEAAVTLDRMMASYAAADAKRFQQHRRNAVGPASAAVPDSDRSVRG